MKTSQTRLVVGIDCFAVSAEKKEGDEEETATASPMPTTRRCQSVQHHRRLPDDEQAAPHCLSFQRAVRDLEAAKSQTVSLPLFLYVCYAANEKDSVWIPRLEDFHIYKDNDSASCNF
jgi:hypothetical protein